MFVTFYLAAALSAAPVPVQTDVYQAEKKSTPAQMVVLRVSRGGAGMRGCRPAYRGRAAYSMPCYTPSRCYPGTACYGAGSAAGPRRHESTCLVRSQAAELGLRDFQDGS
jgi:hypothetical protein